MNTVTINHTLHLDFPKFSTNVLFFFQDPVQDMTVCLLHSLSLSLFFVTLTVLKHTGQVFYRMCLDLGMSDVSP